MTAPAVTECPSCGTQIAPALLVCPSCGALTHSAQIKALAAEADRARAAGDLTRAITQWRAALDLLPPGTRQYDAVAEKVSAIGREIEKSPASTKPHEPDQPWWRRGWALIAAVVIFLLTKGKLLLVGLTKAGTLFSMLAFVGVYWALWGWKFAVPIVLGIYIHEMGHVAVLQRYGFQATAPMFIPGLGAYVRLKQHITDVRQDARIGLAGPVAGLGAALVAYFIAWWTASQLWYAVTQFTAWINLFNLIPFWQLDGGRAFHAMNRAQRVAAAAVIGLVWMTLHQGLLLLLLIVAVWQAFVKAPEEADNGALSMYAVLILVLAWLTAIPVATPN